MCNNSCNKNVSCTVAGCFSCRHSCCRRSCCCASHCYHEIATYTGNPYWCATGWIQTTGTYTYTNPSRTYQCCRCGLQYTVPNASWGTLGGNGGTITVTNPITITGQGGWTSGTITTSGFVNGNNINGNSVGISFTSPAGNCQGDGQDHTEPDDEDEE